MLMTWRERPGKCCSPRHRMPFKLTNKGNQCAWMTWRAICGRPFQKAHRGVDAMLLRLYEPVLFRALAAANPAVRRNACALLVDVFPLQDPEADVGETDQLLARQAGIINQLMGDAAPAAGPDPPLLSSPSP